MHCKEFQHCFVVCFKATVRYILSLKCLKNSACWQRTFAQPLLVIGFGLAECYWVAGPLPAASCLCKDQLPYLMPGQHSLPIRSARYPGRWQNNGTGECLFSGEIIYTMLFLSPFRDNTINMPTIALCLSIFLFFQSLTIPEWCS